MSTSKLPKPVQAAAERVIAPYVNESKADSDRRLRAHFIAFRDQLNLRVSEQMAELADAVDSYIDGARHDALAINHRMAGLEAELAGTHAQLEELTSYVQAIHRDMQRAQAGNAFEGGARPVEVEVAGGLRLQVQPQDLIGAHLIRGQEWEPHVREAIEAAADPLAVAVDAGAFIGLHTLTMAKSFGEVHAFEPQSEVARVLRHNLAINGVTNVAVHQEALFDHATTLSLAPEAHQHTPIPTADGQVDYSRIANAASLAFSEVPVDPADPGLLDVPAITLDSLALADVAFIKVDAQGCDLEVLRGSRETLARCRPIVCFEFEADLAALHGDDMSAYLRFFESLDYEVTVIHEGQPGQQADYLAVPRG